MIKKLMHVAPTPRSLACGLFLPFLFLNVPAAAQMELPPPPPPLAPGETPATLPSTKQWDMASKAAGRTYRVQVFRPLQPPPPEGYPVLFVTDGDTFFAMAASQILVRSLGEARPALVVGIGYPILDIGSILLWRTRDLTPTPGDAKWLEMMKPFKFTTADSGGADLFYRFIDEELRPRISAEYQINPKDQTLFGHSLGGLFVLHTLFNHPGSFRNFVAASPSIWWDDRALLKELPDFRQTMQRSDARPRLLMTVGGDESNPKAWPVNPAQKDKPPEQDPSRMVGSMQELAAELASVKGLTLKSHVFEGENHLSVQPPSLARAISFSLALPTYRDLKAADQARPAGAPSRP